MRKILSIEYDIPGFPESFERYSSSKSLLDYDLVIFRPFMNSHSYDYYDGKPSYDESSSRYFRDAESHWNREIDEYLKSGNNLFIILNSIDTFYIKTGNKQYTGTGKSRQTINIVTEKTNYDFIKRVDFPYNAEGNEFLCKNTIFKDFYNDFKAYLTYRVYTKSDTIEPTFTTKHGSRIVGGVEKVGNGRIIYLPVLDFEIEEFITENEEEKEIWTDTALKIGKRYIQHIINIEKQISGKEVKSIQPEWVDLPEFELEAVGELKSKIDIIQNKVDNLIEESNGYKDKIQKENSLKDLLFETGIPLESSVIFALKILGYKAENYDDGQLELDQVITSPEKERFIGECEGKDNKAIDISKLRQLSDSINEDFEKNELTEESTGLIFGNPQRLLSPNERTEDFTVKCLSAAKRRGIGLILTPDLFDVCKYLNENKDNSYKKKCRQAIRKGIGGIIKFPEITNKNNS